MDNFKATQEAVAYLREQLENELWRVQLTQFPDSVRLAPRDALEWLDDRPKPHYDLHHREQIARAICMTIQYPVGVFYQCGKRADGSYAWRGFRYGTGGSEYLSGFGTW